MTQSTAGFPPRTAAPVPRASALAAGRLATSIVAALVIAVFPGWRGVEADPSSATGSADVRLVRLLSELPDSVQKNPLHLHDLRVRMAPGNVLLFRKHGEFATVLPIELITGTPNSLRYFYYVEKSPIFWVLGGSRTKGILTVADGGDLQFGSFRLLWGQGEEGLGWIYFPDVSENWGLRFSVVSGQSVDRADPKGTKYWVELGAESKEGF